MGFLAASGRGLYAFVLCGPRDRSLSSADSSLDGASKAARNFEVNSRFAVKHRLPHLWHLICGTAHRCAAGGIESRQCLGISDEDPGPAQGWEDRDVGIARNVDVQGRRVPEPSVEW